MTTTMVLPLQVYPWDQKTVGTVLSSFFWGYAVMQVPGSMLVQRFGPRRFLLAAMAGCSVLAILTPLAVRLGDVALLITTRVCQVGSIRIFNKPQSLSS